MFHARVSLVLLVSILLQALQQCSHAQLQDVNIVEAVETLAGRFEALKNEGLGVSTLEVSGYLFMCRKES